MPQTFNPAERLRELRKMRGFTVDELANKTLQQIDGKWKSMSKQTISQYENGAYSPSVKKFKELLTLLDAEMFVMTKENLGKLDSLCKTLNVNLATFFKV